MLPVRQSNHGSAPASDAFVLGAPINPKLPVTDRLAQSRLGACTGLFFALRARHPSSADHSLRVALGGSKWATFQAISDRDRDLLEVAALLHEIGKIGVPDSLLQKQGHLNAQELQAIEKQFAVEAEILRGAGATEELIEILQKSRQSAKLPNQPIAARMLAILDVFDSMTNSPASISRDRAIEELFSLAGTQFDTGLVENFVAFITEPRPEIDAALAQRWLTKLERTATPGFWEWASDGEGGAAPNAHGQNAIEALFHYQMLASLSDAAVYLDFKGQVISWNGAAERLTGRAASSLLRQPWSSHAIGLKNESGGALTSEDCPLTQSLVTQSSLTIPMKVTHVDGRDIVVELTSVPIFSGQQQFVGAILVIRDMSANVTLEQKVQSLHEFASQDQLTKVGNRAELDRRLPLFLEEHLAAGRRGSLIMCDIDFFKRINDQHGHQAGDEALVTFAALLRDEARSEDFVARYGGEEFVVICAGCDHNAVKGRAEQMRLRVETTPIAALNRRTMTASFGVTEILLGDGPETLLERADRALLMAKESGRNRVVQIGAGRNLEHERKDTEGPTKSPSWTDWFRGSSAVIIEKAYIASVPKSIAIQKLEGFIKDHYAELAKVEESRVVVRVGGQRSAGSRRLGERSTVLLLDVEVLEVKVRRGDRQKTYQNRTKFVAKVRSVRARDRRSEAVRGQALQLLRSFQSYLVAEEIDDALSAEIILPR